MLKGIDVSYHKGSLDWNKIKSAGVDFAILRAGYGKLIGQKDEKFEKYYSGAKQAGIPVGCYWYSYAKSVAEIQTEAEIFLQAIKGKQFEYPVYLDFEESSQFALGRVKCSEMAKAFLEIVEKAGYFTGLYSSKSHLESYFTEDILTRYTVWVAHYGVSQTSYRYPYDIWQYSETGKLDGVSGKFDLNYCYQENFPEIIRKAGLNGFPKSVENPVEIQKEIIEDTYRKSGQMNFGHALEALKQGKCVARTGWNGKDMFLFLSHGSELNRAVYDKNFPHGENMADCADSICMKTAQNTIVIGWLASQTDMLAEDWKIIE